ncbi:MAG TPA: VCBS repeat-containing protein [Pyrinomonadaceae bacterium]|nr:VCBS repeat-containing protein [Pyrinomonadaceae bacterium]
MRNLFIAIVLLFAVTASAWAQCNTSCTKNPPGQRWPLIDWRFVNRGDLPQTHGVYMTEDNLLVTVDSGDSLSLGPNEIEMVLTSNVDWRKEVVAFSPCTGRGQTIATQGSNKGPVHMRITKSNCTGDTVLLRKEKFFFGMQDMYHFDPARFFRLWGGKIITINWWSDNFVSNPFPPTCNFPCVPTSTVADQGILYDTDGKADVAVWRQNFSFGTANWFAKNSSTGATVQKLFGQPGDVPVPYDYDGDGRTDMALWRPSTGEWLVINSLTGQLRTVQWGTFGDTPVPGDYDGDRKADLAVWRPSTGNWHIKGYITGGLGLRVGGGFGDVAVSGDYDGDRLTDAAVWNNLSGNWNIFTYPSRTVTFGHINDIPVPADYDGDFATDFATFQNGFWYIKYNIGGVESNYGFGGPGDTPVPRDYDGDRIADRAVFRPWTSEWFIGKSTDNTLQIEVFGGAGDIPVPSK